jgi:uncharacterized protein (TIGR02145 family)
MKKSNWGYLTILIIILGLLSSSCKKKEVLEVLEVPVLTTSEISNITAITAASGGNITDEGSSPVIVRGVCWTIINETEIIPTIRDFNTTDSAGAGSFVSILSGLYPNFHYLLRAYATNDEGTGYGMPKSFTTRSGTVAALTTGFVTSVTRNSAFCSSSSITSNGGYTYVNAYGIYFGTSQNPEISGTKLPICESPVGVYIVTFSTTLSGLIPDTEYFVKAYVTNEAGTGFGEQVSFRTLSEKIPELTTSNVTHITKTEAICGGNITFSGAAPVTERGVFWGTSLHPEITGTKLQSGSGDGSFSITLSGLIPDKEYFVRAYATNSVGTSYGNELIFKTYSGTVTDIDGNIYYTVTIGTQVWMAENLKTTKYYNGDLIGTTTPATKDIVNEIYSGSTAKYQWAYDGNESNVATYGRLYTWSTVNTGALCPQGWHVPTDVEWTTLTDYLTNNGYGYQGSGSDIAKSMAATTCWLTYEIAAGIIGYDQSSNNSSGFTSLPGGFRAPSGPFIDIGNASYLWSATEYNSTYSWNLGMGYYSSSVTLGNNYKYWGYSVRCLRD